MSNNISQHALTAATKIVRLKDATEIAVTRIVQEAIDVAAVNYVTEIAASARALNELTKAKTETEQRFNEVMAEMQQELIRLRGNG
jgi:hypothetical protein